MKADKPGEIVLYRDVPHVFFADSRPRCRMEPAEVGWKRLPASFKLHGVTC